MSVREPSLGASLTSLWSNDGYSSAPTSPKLSVATSAPPTWYRYYAGYADGFVADVIRALPAPAGVVLDPWNGSGTTTSVAAAHGINAQGFDLNPVAIVIAKARLLRSDVAASIMPLSRELLQSLPPVSIADSDPLLRWLTPRAVQALRRLGSSIHTALIGTGPVDAHGHWCEAMSSLAALFYLGYFKVVRRTLAAFVGSNPTWIRQRVDPSDRVAIDLRTLRPWFIAAMTELSTSVTRDGLPPNRASVGVALGHSSRLPISDRSIDAVITSPPYCTRIDYVIATLPELAALRVSTAACRNLREQMIGTPTVAAADRQPTTAYGETAQHVLESVASHTSRASATYYSTFFHQYFTGMYHSLAELHRVVKPTGSIVLVAQDSHYKDLHVDLPAAITDMGGALGWSLQTRQDFAVKTKANINRHTRRYRDHQVATEAVLVFTR